MSREVQMGAWKPRVAVIGCGRIGVAEHLPCLVDATGRDLCTLVAVCDADESRAARAGRQFGVPSYTALDETIDRARPDLVTLACLPPPHLDLARRALDS